MTLGLISNFNIPFPDFIPNEKVNRSVHLLASLQASLVHLLIHSLSNSYLSFSTHKVLHLTPQGYR